MLPFVPMHDFRDDQAPRDYIAAPSANEGVRRQRAQRMHRDPAQDVLAPAPELLHKPAQLDEFGLPEDPFHPPEETQRPRRSRVARYAEPQPAAESRPLTQSVPMAEPSPLAAFKPPVQPKPVMDTQPVVQPQPLQPTRPMTGARTAMPSQPQFDRPATPDIPDWLRTARQNNTPAPQRPSAPRVQTAPRRETLVDGYQQAGYPEELLQAQREQEHQLAATPVRRRHGAQYAVPPSYAPQPAPKRAAPVSYAPPSQPAPRALPTEEAAMSRAYHRPRREEPETYRVEEDDGSAETEATGIRIPWLGIAAFAAVMIAVVLWIMQVQYANQTQDVLQKRAAQEAQILESHPLKYRELISDKANKYNLHPAFVAAIMLNESSFRPDATSNVDARGLMQLMDDTAGWIYDKMDDPSRAYSFDDLYDPEINAEYGCWYLNYLSELFYGDPILVAAAFHAGQGEVRNWLNDSTYSKDGKSIRLDDMIDGPTKRYVTRVLSDYAAYKRLYFGG